MDLSDLEKETVETYDASAASWRDVHDTSAFWANEMSQFHALLASGKVLDVGTGAGRDCKELQALGYNVAGLDISAGLLGVARDRNPGIVFYHASIYSMSSVLPDVFDGLWCAAVFLHVPADKTAQALKNMRKAVRKDGIVFISTKKGEGQGMEKITYDDKALNRFVKYWSKSDFQDRCQQSGFNLIDYHELNERHNTWMCFYLRAI
jgi:SAM-dependent methyltransferase